MNEVLIRKERQTIPTYLPKKANDLPMFFENKYSELYFDWNGTDWNGDPKYK